MAYSSEERGAMSREGLLPYAHETSRFTPEFYEARPEDIIISETDDFMGQAMAHGRRVKPRKRMPWWKRGLPAGTVTAGDAFVGAEEKAKALVREWCKTAQDLIAARTGRGSMIQDLEILAGKFKRMSPPGTPTLGSFAVASGCVDPVAFKEAVEKFNLHGGPKRNAAAMIAGDAFVGALPPNDPRVVDLIRKWASLYQQKHATAPGLARRRMQRLMSMWNQQYKGATGRGDIKGQARTLGLISGDGFVGDEALDLDTETKHLLSIMKPKPKSDIHKAEGKIAGVLGAICGRDTYAMGLDEDEEQIFDSEEGPGGSIDPFLPEAPNPYSIDPPEDDALESAVDEVEPDTYMESSAMSGAYRRGL